MNKTVIYYTSNREEETFEQKIIDTMLKNKGDLPIISVTQKPMNLGHNICIGDVGHSYLNERKQILIAARQAKTEYVITTESDFLYPSDYFNFEPSGHEMYRWENIWIMWLDDNRRKNFYRKTSISDGAGVVKTSFLIDLLTKYLKPYPNWHEKNDKTIDPRHSPYHHVGYELIKSENPCVSIKSNRGLTYITGVYNDDTKDSLPYWGNVNKLRKKLA